MASVEHPYLSGYIISKHTSFNSVFIFTGAFGRGGGRGGGGRGGGGGGGGGNRPGKGRGE